MTAIPARPEKQTVEEQCLGAKLGATGMNNLLMFRTRMDGAETLVCQIRAQPGDICGVRAGHGIAGEDL